MFQGLWYENPSHGCIILHLPSLLDRDSRSMESSYHSNEHRGIQKLIEGVQQGFKSELHVTSATLPLCDGGWISYQTLEEHQVDLPWPICPSHVLQPAVLLMDPLSPSWKHTAETLLGIFLPQWRNGLGLLLLKGFLSTSDAMTCVSSQEISC